MACWRIDGAARGADDGFATPAAAVVSLGLAVVASAITGLAVAELKSAQSDEAKTRVAYRLDGAQQQAALSVATDPKATRLAWSMPAVGGSADVLAEAEGSKLGVGDGAALDGAVLTRLGVTDTADLRGRLQRLTQEQAIGGDLENADAALGWRVCARSLISVYGVAKTSPGFKSTLPAHGNVVVRMGEVWRIRVAADGWADDRIVRLTGDALHPAAVIDRRFYRRTVKEDRCAALLAAR